jgi:hypothetical protein
MDRHVTAISLPPDRITIRYAATYYFLSRFDDFISEDLILDRYLSDYFETAIWDYIVPFPKWTALHMFSSLFAGMVLDADFDRAAQITYVRKGSCLACIKFPLPPAYLLAADLCRIHSIDASTLHEELRDLEFGRPCCLENGQIKTGSDLEDAWDEWKLEEGNEQLLAQIAEEMFFVLFANRSFLRRFNLHMAIRIQSLDEPDEGHAHLLRAEDEGRSRLVRAHPPGWAKRAVFFRDRGYCCACGRNLENSRSPINNAHFDHIVPLAAGGMNDVTNLQLLCRSCNADKRAQVTDTSDLYERWYPIDRNYQPRTAETLESVVLKLFAHDNGT